MRWQRATRYDLIRDSRAIFTETYARMTEIIARELSRRSWNDPAWVVKLAETFAARHFEALDAYDQGVLEASAWLTTFEAVRKKRTSVVEAVICAMGCHIIHDLPLALAATLPGHQYRHK